jgi:DUF1365 family protein
VTGAPLTGLAGAYEGIVWHERFARPGRKEPGRRFAYRVTMMLLDAAEPEAALAAHRWYSARRPAPKRFRRTDYHGDPAVPLDEAVRQTVAGRLGSAPPGPVLLLTQLRTWGTQFNPISCYYCLDESGRRVDALLVEVTNTPWHERHAYVVPGPGTHHLDKAFHVSPFFPMDQQYRVSYEEPGERVGVAFDVLEGGERRLAARLELRRTGRSRDDLAHALWHYPAGTMAVSAAIYRQALGLWRSGATFHPHPAREHRRRTAG